MERRTLRGIYAVIFDCDGVLFDSRQANANFYNHLLSYFGLPLMKDEDLTFVHMHTAERSVQHIFRGTPYIEAAQAYRSGMDYAPFIQDMVMEPGLMEVLQALRPQFRLGIATNRSNTIPQVLETHGLGPFFDIVVSSLDVKRPKPDPEALHRILAFFGISPREALYIGDSLVDSETARAARVPFASYKNDEIQADFQLNHIAEVLDLLNERKGKSGDMRED